MSSTMMTAAEKLEAIAQAGYQVEIRANPTTYSLRVIRLGTTQNNEIVCTSLSLAIKRAYTTYVRYGK